MGLVQSEIGELRSLLVDVKEGVLPLEKIEVMVRIYGQISKRVDQMLQIAKISQGDIQKEKTWKKMVELNIISDSDAIAIEGHTVIKCPEMGGRLITREDCLDFSGDSKHIDDCQNCKQFTITRKYIT